jgi:CubicO group peptidase (beta-lactamase class C family)
MKLNRRHVLGAGATALAATAVSDAGAATRSTGGTRAHARALSALSRYVEQHRTDWGLPGMTVCVVDRDGYAGFITSGWANRDSRTAVNADHLFQVGSISKVFSALTIASIEQEGKVSRRAKVKDLMPDIRIAGGDDITVQHLLNHTSGLPADPPLFPQGGLWSGYAPGSHWSYSNTGYQIAGLIAAEADGRLLGESIEARVLRPLGMTNSVGGIRHGDRARYAQGYEPLYGDRAQLRPGPLGPSPWVDSDNAAGCVSATAGDMALFLRFLLELAEGRGGAVLSDASAASFMADPADAPDWAEGAKYGNGLARITIDDRPFLHHTGGMVSFSSSMHIDPAAGVACFASANVSYGLSYRPRGVSIYACQLMRMVRESTEAPTPAPTRPVIPGMDRFAGTYTAASGEAFDIRIAGERATMRYNGRDSEMQPVAPIAFACTDPRFAAPGLIFDIDDQGVIRAWAHEVEFLRDPSRGYRPAPSAELRALSGIYVNDDRWGGTVAIIARDGKLWLNNAEALVALPDGSWRAGANEWSPERARFDSFVDGRPTRVLLSGSPYVRRFS